MLFYRRYVQLLVLPLTAVFMVLFIMIPAVSIPGNSFAFQLHIYALGDWVMLILVALLNTLIVFSITERIRNGTGTLSALFSGSVGGVSGALASVFGAVSCPMCVASLFAFLGIAGAGTLVDYRQLIFVGLIGIALIVLYRQLYQLRSVAPKYE